MVFIFNQNGNKNGILKKSIFSTTTIVNVAKSTCKYLGTKGKILEFRRLFFTNS
jgi:hypothetical protein